MRALYLFVIRERIPLLIAIVILIQNPFWLFWHYAALISFVFIFLLFVSLKKNSLIYISPPNRLPIILLSLFFLVLPIVRGGLHLSSFFYVFCFVLAYNFPKEESDKAYSYIVRVLAFVLSFSLPAWLLHITGVYQFPMIGSLDLSAVKQQGADEGSTIMENYFFFVLKGGLDQYRFYSVFDEPGVLGTLGAYLLYAAKYNLSKWYNLIIFISCLFTFSLAFYVLTFIGYMYYSTKSVRKFLYLMAGLVLIGLFVYSFLMENEVFISKVIDRTSDLGDSMDRRTGSSVSYFLEQAGLITYLFGIGVEKMAELDLLQGASYKLFIVENGLLALLVLIYAYFKLNPCIQSDILMFNLLFWASFLQRPTAFLAWQIFIFAIITRLLLKERHHNAVVAGNIPPKS